MKKVIILFLLVLTSTVINAQKVKDKGFKNQKMNKKKNHREDDENENKSDSTKYNNKKVKGKFGDRENEDTNLKKNKKNKIEKKDDNDDKDEIETTDKVGFENDKYNYNNEKEHKEHKEQKKVINTTHIPAPVAKQFSTDYPNTINPVWTKSKGKWTASFNNNNTIQTVTYDANGKKDKLNFTEL